MRRFGFAAFALLMLCGSLTSFGVSANVGLLQFAAPASGGCSPGAAATNFLARTSGLNGTETAAYCVMINGLVTDGIITGNLSGAAGCGTILDGLWILATNTTTTAKLNLCGTSYGLVYHGTPSESSQFTADVGYTGDGSTVFFDTQLPLNGSQNFTQNSASLGSFIQTNQTSADATVVMGSATGGLFGYQSPMNTGSVFTFELNGSAFTGQANTTSKGAWVNSRTSSSTVNLYKNANATPFGTSADTSGGVPTTDLCLFAYCTNGVISGNSFTSYQISAFFEGAGLTATQAVAVENRVNTFLTSNGGHNVF